MRPIKFRAWIEDRFVYDDGHLGYFFGQIDVFALVGGKPILEQFTGLLDKSGKEIYEGDILRIRDKWSEPVMDKVNVKVFFQEGAFWVNGSLLADCCVYSEVIGNIHENPELLK